MTYDKNNIFAKILKGEIPCNKIYENEYVFSFYDINPQKKIHALIIPKGEYEDLDDFTLKASDKEISELIKGINIVAKKTRYLNKWWKRIQSVNKYWIKWWSRSATFTFSFIWR